MRRNGSTFLITTVTAVVAVLALITSVDAAAQSAPQFPDDAKPLTADQLRERLGGKVFHVATAQGTTWRLQYQGGGSFFVDVSNGYRDKGKWRVEESKVCSEPERGKPSCNEVRLVGDLLHLRRDSGEIIKLEPR
jgi:hypothetical protein